MSLTSFFSNLAMAKHKAKQDVALESTKEKVKEMFVDAGVDPVTKEVNDKEKLWERIRKDWEVEKMVRQVE